MSAQTVISRPSSVRTNAGRRSVIQKSRLEAMDRPAVLGCLTQIRPQPRPITSEAVRKTRCRISGPWSRIIAEGRDGASLPRLGHAGLMRSWHDEEPQAKQAVQRDDETVGYVTLGRAELTVERADDQTPNRAAHGSFQLAPNTVIASPRSSWL
jgi:hypothetical protein